MNARHATVLALVGWCLMVPPYVSPYSQNELFAPVSEWRILQRFDTAADCESQLQKLKEGPVPLPGEYTVATKFKNNALKRMGEMGIGLFASKDAQCVLVE